MTSQAKVKDRAKEISREQGVDDSVHTLSTGFRVVLHPVSGALVEDVRSAIKMPKVPVVYIEAKDREEENPNDPAYMEAVERANMERGNAVLDAIITFGVELVDGVPEDDSWLRKLQMLERRGRLDLSGFDLEDEFDREYVFKRFVAVAGADYPLIMPLHGIRAAEVTRHRVDTFLGDQERNPARRLRAEERGPDEHRDEPSVDGVGSSLDGEAGSGEVG